MRMKIFGTCAVITHLRNALYEIDIISFYGLITLASEVAHLQCHDSSKRLAIFCRVFIHENDLAKSD